MRFGRVLLGMLAMVVGIVWFLQGVRVLPGSFMTGSTFWAVAGLVVAIAGVATIVLSLRPPKGA